MPVCAPARTCTTTIVVDVHSSVPSDSCGSSVGILYAFTSRASIGYSTRRLPAVGISVSAFLGRLVGTMRNHAGNDLLERFLDDAQFVRIAFAHRLQEVQRLFARDVRRQRRHVAVDDRL